MNTASTFHVGSTKATLCSKGEECCGKAVRLKRRLFLGVRLLFLKQFHEKRENHKYLEYFVLLFPFCCLANLHLFVFLIEIAVTIAEWLIFLISVCSASRILCRRWASDSPIRFVFSAIFHN